MSASPAPCPDSVVLEAIAVGRSAAPGVHTHLAACPLCRERLAQIRDDNRFLNGFFADGAVPVVTPPGPASSIDIPGYVVTREIHRGGQGVVYQAMQRSTKRHVAVKVMKQGPFATLADRARFEREVETLGRLDHPNIVTVHDAGTVAGFQYLVMDYVDGPPLDEALSASGAAPLPHGAAGGAAPRERLAAALRTFTKVCDAVHAAHLRGVIHRDLKPSNIRVDRDGEPHVLDFGLATSTDAQRDNPMTQTGQFVGSLPWASPEQVEGIPSRIDLRTDVYSLGVILFQLLTGRMPYDVGSKLPDAIDRILRGEPPRPSTVADADVGRFDDDLDTIVLKCLEKDRDRRYQSAGELARDLRRYLAGEAIEAKRDSAIYVLRKILRRYRYPVAAGVALVVLLAVFGGLMAVLYQRSARLEREAVQSADALANLLSQSNVNQGRMAGMLGNMHQSESLLWRELLTHRQADERAAVHLNDPPGSLAARWALWELYRRFPCRRTVRLPFAQIRCATLAKDGASVWVADSDGLVQNLDMSGARRDSYRIRSPATPGLPLVDETGDTVLWASGTRLAVWDRATGERPTFENLSLAIADIDGFSKPLYGSRFACVSGGVAIVWSVRPPHEIGRFESDDADLVACAISSDGTRLAARDKLGGLYLWDVESGEQMATIARPARPVEVRHNRGELLFSPDGRLLADAWIDTPGRVWDLNAAPPKSVVLSESAGDRRIQSFSHDGRFLAVGDLGGAVRIFDTRTGQRLASFVAHVDRVWSICFAAEDDAIWTSASDALRCWDFAPDAGVQVVQISGDVFHCADFTPDGRDIVAGGMLGQLHRVDAQTLSVSSVDFGNAATVSCTAISPDGRRVAVATYANALFVWDDADWERPPRNYPHPRRISHACFSPDGTRIATACDDGAVRIWRTADAILEHELRTDAARLPQVAYSPDGRRLAAAARDGALLVWDVETRVRQTWREATGAALRAVCFSPDGQRLIAVGADRTVDIWDVARRTLSASHVGHNQEIYCLDVSRDGELIASGDAAGVIHLWGTEGERPLVTLDGHTGAVMSVRFSHDGRSLVSASLDGTLRIWDLAYYDRHVAGNVDAQLQRIGADDIDPERAAAWRAWAADIIASNKTD